MKRLLFVMKLAVVSVLIAGMMLVSGCQNDYDPDAFHVFYVNEEKTRLLNLEYDVQATVLEDQVAELLDELTTGSDRAVYGPAIPSNVNILNYEVADGFLKIYFDNSYKDMSNIEEILCRSAIVKTLVQLDGVYNVAFFVNNNPLTDATGEIVGAMNDSSFIDNPGEDIQNIQETELVLYYASASGKYLTKEVQKVYYNSNKSAEKLIIERLMDTPNSENAQSAIPSGTQLVNISVLDGICVVNFDAGFKNYNYDISEEVVIYSIVNSLTELNTVKAVQITINGETNMVYREKMNLSEQYARNLSLVKDGEEEETVEIVDDVAPRGGALNNRTE